MLRGEEMRKVLNILLAVALIATPLALLIPASAQAAYTGYVSYLDGNIWYYSNVVSMQPAYGMNIARLSDGSFICFFDGQVNPSMVSTLIRKPDSSPLDGDTYTVLWESSSLISQSPVVCVDSSDNIHVAYFGYNVDHYELHYMRFNPDGTLAEGPTTLDTLVNWSYGKTSPIIEVDENDYIFVVWQDDDDLGGNDDILAIKRTAPTTWGSVQTALDGETYGYDQCNPDAWCDDEEDLWIVGHGKGHGTYTTVDSVWAIEWGNITGWQPLDVVRNENGFHHRYVRGCMSTDLDFHIVWQKTNASTNANTIYYKLSDDGGATWEVSEEVSLEVDNTDFNSGPSVSVGSSDEVIHVFWMYQYDGNPYGRAMTREKRAGSWVTYTPGSVEDFDIVSLDYYTRWVHSLHSYYPVVNSQHTNIALTGAFMSYARSNDEQAGAMTYDCDFPFGEMRPYVNTGASTAQDGYGGPPGFGAGWEVLYLSDLTPNFSAIYQYELGLTGDSSYYQVYVKDGPNFDAASTLWQSGWTSMTSISFGERCEDITYAGSALTPGTRYYWLIQFRDSLSVPTKYSGFWTDVIYSFSISYGSVDYTRADYGSGGYPMNVVDSCRASDGRIYVLSRSYIKKIQSFPQKTWYRAVLNWSDDEGETWDGELVEGCDAMAYGYANLMPAGAIAIDSDNKVHIIWGDDGQGSVDSAFFYNSRTSAGVWGTAFELYDYPLDDYACGVDIEVDDEKDVHTWYAHYDPGSDGYLRYRKYTYPTGWGSSTTVWGGANGDDGIPYVDGIVTYSSRADDAEWLGVKYLVWGEYDLMIAISTTTGVGSWTPFPVFYDEPNNASERSPSDWFYDPDDDEFVFFWQEMFDVTGTKYARPVTSRIALSFFPYNYSKSLYCIDPTYLTAWNSASATLAPQPDSRTGQTSNYGGDFGIFRTGMLFDTTDIPSGTVSACEFHYYVNSEYWSTNNYDVQVVEGTGVTDPIVEADYGDLKSNTTVYASWSVTAQDLSVNAWEDLVLNAAGRTHVENQLGGSYVTLGLRTDREIAGTTPSSHEYVRSGGASWSEPYLEVTVDGTEYTSYLIKYPETILDDPGYQIDTADVTRQMQCVRNNDDEWIFWFDNDNGALEDGVGMYLRIWDTGTETWSSLTRTDLDDTQIINPLYHEWPDIGGKQTNIADAGFFCVREGSTYYGTGTGGAWPDPPDPPTAPTNMLVQGVVDNPDVTDLTPDMSSQYNDPDTGDYADYYEIEVGTDTDWGSAEMWDSGKTLLTTPCLEGTQCENITYAGSTLGYDTTYYWRMKFWDQGGLEGVWSSTGQFTTAEFVSGTPLVTTYAATDYSGATAKLHGQCQHSGGDDPVQSRFQYDVDSGAPYAYSTSWSSTFNPPDVFEDTIPIISGQTYYFIAQAKNNSGNIGSGTELSFQAGLGNPSITTQPATSVTISTSRLNSYLNTDGGEDCYVRFQHGTTEEGYGQDDDADTEIWGNNWLSQVFEAQATYSVTGALVKVYKEGTPGDDLEVELRNVSGGDPGVTVHASGTLVEADIDTGTAGDWYACEFSSPYAVTATTDYALVLYSSSAPGTANCYHWFYDSTGGYDGTDAYYDISADGGSSWTPDTGKDLMFGMFSVWSGTTWVNSYSTGMNPYFDLTGLTEGMPYRVRAQVYNSYNGIGSPVSGDTETFVTLDYILKPSNMLATTVSATEISVSWTRGTGAQQTRVMYKMGEYPTDHDDGTEGYFGIGSSANIGSLTPGTTYYFAAWSYAPGSPADYWSDYEPIDAPTSQYAMDGGSNTTTVIEADLKSTTDGFYVGDELYNTTRSDNSTVTVYDGGSTTITISPAIVSQTTGDAFYLESRCEAMSTTWAGVDIGPYPYAISGETPNWFLEPSDNAFLYLPGRGVIVSAAVSIGLTPGAMFFLLVVLVAVIIGFLLFMFTRNLMLVIGAIGVVLIIGLISAAVPGWVFFLYLAIGIPSGYLLSKGAAGV